MTAATTATVGAGPAALRWRVARALADGRFHSGQKLADAFGVSRTMIWRAVRELEALGLEIHSVTGKGYRLPVPLEWLDPAALRDAVPAAPRDRLGAVTVLEETDSTNRQLLAAGPPAPGRMAVCIAEYQHGGRGRRGRHWFSPPGAGVWLSVSWLFERQPAQISALGLAAGLAARRALVEAGVPGVALKWPNDLVAGERKLGGVLAELRAESNGPAFVVLGVGVNWNMPPALRVAIAAGGGLPVTDVAELCAAAGQTPPGRTALAAALTGAFASLLADYAASGFEPWRREWAAADALAGRFVRVESGAGELKGTARGIDADGALLVETGSCLKRVIAGEVSVRTTG